MYGEVLAECFRGSPMSTTSRNCMVSGQRRCLVRAVRRGHGEGDSLRVRGGDLSDLDGERMNSSVKDSVLEDLSPAELDLTGR